MSSRRHEEKQKSRGHFSDHPLRACYRVEISWQKRTDFLIDSTNFATSSDEASVDKKSQKL